MSDSRQTWKRRRLNPPPEAPASSPQNRRTSNVERELDVYDDIEGAHDSPSMHQRRRHLTNGHAVEYGGGDDTSVAHLRKASGRKRISKRASDESGRLVGHLEIQELERSQPTSPKGRKRKNATGMAAISTDEDELGNEVVDGPGQQLLLEASLAQTPVKRKRGRPRKIVSQHGLIENGTTPTPSRQSKHSEKELHQTPTKAHRKTPGRARREIEIIVDIDDELQLPNRHAETTLPEFHSEAQTSDTHGHRVLPRHDTQPHVDLADTQTLSEPMQSQFDLIKRAVLEKLSQNRPIPLTGLDDEYKKVYQLLEATVTVGESNSMLLIGVRGSGKTTLVNQAIRELSREQKDNFHVVRLNGFLHTDDKLALRDIWRQLGRFESDDDGPSKSYADTLAMLLALLSHPSENRSSNNEDTVAKSVIFIMDEFDLFASHPRQTLLYNLLDIAQSRKAPIAVLGLTTRLDVTEGLEKRVKSRFSHRYVYLRLPSSLSAFTEIIKAAVVLDPSEPSLHENAAPILIDSDRHSKKKKKRGAATATASDPALIRTWNSSVTSLFGHPSFLNVHVRPIYYTSKSIPALLSSLIIPIALLTSPAFEPTAFLSKSIDLLQPPQSNLHLLASLSDAALSLLISACRLTILHATDAVNFSLAYSEYVSLASKARLSTLSTGAVAVGGAAGARVWGREVCKREWERLVGLGLLVNAVGTAGGGGAEAGAQRGGASGMVRVDVALEEIPGALAGGLTGVMERWCKQL